MSRLLQRAEPEIEATGETERRRLPMGPLSQVSKVGQQANAARQRMQGPAQAVLKDLLANPSLLAAFAVAVGTTAVGLGVVATNTANDAKDQVASAAPVSLPPAVQAQLDALTATTVDNNTPSEHGDTTLPTPTTRGTTASGTTTSFPDGLTELPDRVDGVNDDLNGIRAELAALGTTQEGLSGSQSKLADLAARTATAAADLADITDDLNTQLAATDVLAADALTAAQQADGKAAAAGAAALDAAVRAEVGRDYTTTAEATGGEWAGKSVWRRTFHAAGGTGFDTLMASDLTAADVDDVLSLEGTGVTSFNNAYLAFPFYDGTHIVYPYVAADGVHVWAFNTAISDFTVTITYTKP